MQRTYVAIFGQTDVVSRHSSSVLETFTGRHLTQIQNAVFLCYIAVVPQGREAPRCIARFCRRFALPAHQTIEVGA
jgi:hypothetical protein